MTAPAMRLAVRGIGKAFGATPALADVSFDVRPGSIHALLGENGAGKSTLMKIVAGALRPDRGTLALDGEGYAPPDPLAARRRGVAIVYQEPSVCPDLTVAENVLLGVEPRRFGWILRREAERRVVRALEPLARGGRPLPLHARVGSLPAGERQLVEIARALAADSVRLLVLDEPTSSLAADDVDRLFEVLRALRASGIAVLYISHFLEEVRRIADEHTVLRDGGVVSGGKVADSSNDALVAAMAGHPVEALGRPERDGRAGGDGDGRLAAPAPPRPDRESEGEGTRDGEVILALHELEGVRLPARASLELRRGEVLGIAGLVGSGRTELLRAVFGLDRVRRGEVRVGQLRAGAVRSGRASPARRLAQGVGMLSEDRAGEGLALGLSVAENLTLSKLGPLRRRGLLSARAEAREARLWIERLGIRCRDPGQPLSELSGGNQQKVALARLLRHGLDVLLLDEPTRGIDVGSRQEVHRLIATLAAEGKAVLMVSSQLSELLEVCHRIAVMHRGVLGRARPAAALTEPQLLSEATGA